MIKPKNCKIRQFKEWLDTHGAAILASTSPYEIVRFRTRKRVSVIWVNKFGAVTTMTGDAEKAWNAFSTGSGWTGGLKTARDYRQGKRHQDIICGLAERDGWTCAYCGTLLTIETGTVEHVIPLTRGGAEEIKNMVLACRTCNAEAGHMNIRQKIELAVKKRTLIDVSGKRT